MAHREDFTDKLFHDKAFRDQTIADASDRRRNAA